MDTEYTEQVIVVCGNGEKGGERRPVGKPVNYTALLNIALKALLCVLDFDNAQYNQYNHVQCRPYTNAHISPYWMKPL